jgi:hypothetical protein
MLSKPISAKVIYALALAILVAWAGHTSALFLGPGQSSWAGTENVHVHGNDATSCAACVDHYHSSLTADHLHETPHLTTQLSIATQAERAQPIEAPRYFIPARPIFLFERPPRPTTLL